MSENLYKLLKDQLDSLHRQPAMFTLKFTLLLGIILFAVGMLRLSTQPPYVLGISSIQDQIGSKIASVLLIVVSLGGLKYLRNKSARDRPAFFAEILPFIDEYGFNAMFHCRGDHKTSLVDKSHRYREVSNVALFDRHGTYFGIYDRRGMVETKSGSDGLIVHVGASGTGRMFSELHVVACDVLRSRECPVHLIEETGLCKIWKISFAEPLSHNSEFHVRWYFRLNFAMNPKGDADAINLRPFTEKPSSAVLTLVMPSKPTTAGFAFITGKKYRLAAPTPAVAERPVYSISIQNADNDGLDGILAYYRSDVHEKCLEIAEMVTVEQAPEAALSEVALLDPKQAQYLA